MPTQTTITESYNKEEITPNYGAISGMQFGLGAVSAFTSGVIGAAINGTATTSLATALSSGTSTIAGQVSSTIISNAVATQTTDLLIDLFNCKSNDGCRIAAAMLGGAAGGLAGWKVGDVVDNSLGVIPVEMFENAAFFQKFINLTIDNPIITSSITGSLTNPLGGIESQSVLSNNNFTTISKKEVKSSIDGNLYVE